MLGTESTLRSGHLLLLLLVASSIILGFSYLNEMYQRIQLQTELAIVERQTQHAVSERLVNQHKLSQLQMKIEVANQEKKRLQDMHEFQTQKQNAYFEKEKQEFLNSISLKEEAISELQDEHESLKIRFDNMYSVLKQFEQNQTRLLEKFATQSTQCMNVINMMSALCSKGKNNIQNILSFNKQKKTLTTAVTSQSSTGMSKPENISLTPSPEGGFTKVQTPLTQTTTHITFSSSGGTQRHLTVGLEVNDLSSEPENMESLKNDQYNATAPKTIAQGPYLNVKEHEKKSSTANRNLVILRKDNFKDEGNFNEIISKNVHIYSPKRQRPKKKWPSDSYKMDQNTLGNVTYLEHLSENEEDTTKNLSVQLTYLGNLNTTRDVINGTQEEGEKKLNFTLSEDRTPQTTIRSNATEKTSEANLVSTLTSLLDVYNIEETDKDGDIKEEKLKYEEIH